MGLLSNPRLSVLKSPLPLVLSLGKTKTNKQTKNLYAISLLLAAREGLQLLEAYINSLDPAR